MTFKIMKCSPRRLDDAALSPRIGFKLQCPLIGHYTPLVGIDGPLNIVGAET